ncbi:MAG TPA: hypothetical protein VMT19_02670, partial [Thermoanaerobaculaceae bacterium]|nr:hypothetical protein [Thermoanaerobaculaceae bacterium]
MINRAILAVAAAGAIWSSAAAAQFAQQGAKLTGTGATGNAWQASATAISSDGNTAIAGGYLDSTGTGAAWVFARSAGAWAQQGDKLVGTSPTGNANQGWAVAISADGNTAIVGGPADNTGAGAAWIFTRSGSSWSQQGNKLVGSGASGAANQGWSVALSGDGNTALVGAPADNTGVGAAWVFARSGSTWRQQGSKLVGTGAVGSTGQGSSGAVASAGQGSSVALSSDGSTAAVGAALDNTGYGAVWVFTRSGSSWSQQGSKLVGSSPATTLRITGAASAQAAFAQQSVPCYTLATAVAPAGDGTVTLNTPRTCPNGYTPGTQISMLVTPSSGWAIVGWSGTGGTFAVASSYQATFTITG